MSVSYALIVADTLGRDTVVADNVQPPGGSSIRMGAPGPAEYEPGHSERQATGWVAVGPDSRWAATLAVPMTGDQSALVTIEREGPTPARAPDVLPVALVVPAGEVEALLTLLRGLFAQARRDGILDRPRGRTGVRLGKGSRPEPR